MARDDFTRHTKSKLAESANGRCVRPGCGRLTQCTDPVTNLRVNFGAAAHDSAASSGGPRFDPFLTPEQRRAFENGAWLCMSCATIVDRLSHLFPQGTLRGWQAQAIRFLASGVLISTPLVQINITEACERAAQFCRRVVEIQMSDYGGFTLSVPWESISKIEALVRDCYQLGPRNPLSTLYSHTIGLQSRVLISLQAIREEVYKNHQCWWYDNETRGYRMCGAPFFFGIPAEQRVAMEESVNRLRTLLSDLYSALEELRNFSQGNYTSETFNLW